MVSKGRLWTAGLFCLVMLFLLSCSGGGINPLTPSYEGGDSTQPGLTSGTGPGGTTAQGQTTQNASLWGYYDLVYDYGSGQFEISPVRSAQFTLNINSFLQPPGGDPANLGVTIKDTSQLISAGIIVLDVEITHPINNPRLVGFDTYGAIIGNAGIEYHEDSGVIFSGPDDLQLLNFDGYTRWMNPVEFTDPGFSGYTPGMLGTKGIEWTATVNAYKFFAEGLTATGDLATYLDSNQDLRGAFLPGTTNAREYQIKFPMVAGAPQIKFQYAIISHFRGAKDDGVPIPEPEIEDFPPDANAPEAVHITANTSGSTLFFDDILMIGGGDLIINLTVYDWQGLEALGGQGSFGEITAIGLDSPDDLFPIAGVKFDNLALAGTEISTPGSVPTTLNLLVQGLMPSKLGPHEILIAVYNNDPDTYGPNMGGAYPEEAKLAGYTRTIVEVKPPHPTENNPPEITEILGPMEVSCWDTETVFTCIATDPDPDTTLSYTYAVVQGGIEPVFINPMSENNTATIDWSDEFEYPPGLYEVWFLVTDGELDSRMRKEVNKSPSGLLVYDITSDDENINNVFCTNDEALYTVTADSCDPDAEIMYRWIRGFGDPPAEIDPDDPNWTEFDQDNFITLSWADTQIGIWWLVAQGFDGAGKMVNSPALNIERVDTPPSDINPPDGADEVDCNNTDEVYTLGGGDDCDGGENEREWTVSQNSTPPTGGWVSAVDDTFTVNWAVYPIGIYYAWQRIGSGGNWSVSEPLEVLRNNTPPYTPGHVMGPPFVDCGFTDAEYAAGEVEDCEGDEIDREWALGIDIMPPVDGWAPFEGTSFIIDFSLIENGSFNLYQRASDNGTDWTYSDGFQVVKINTAPDEPSIPTGPDEVSCYDTEAGYDGGVVLDCDAGDVVTRYYMVSGNPDLPVGDWVEFAGNTFNVDWSQFATKDWYLIQKATDGEQEVTGHSLAVVKTNAAPEVGTPTGQTDVDCTSIEIEYTEGAIFDCDPETMFFKDWILSQDPDEPAGLGNPYEGTTFLISFDMLPSGDYYLYVRVNDGIDSSYCDPLHIVRHNTAPEKPDAPDGPTEIDCTTNPGVYVGGEIVDCDPFDTHTRYHYISTDPLTPTGGEWVQALGNQLIVDFYGVVAEQPYYLFQKVSDGELEAISDSFEVVYHNTEPNHPSPPSGEQDVSCANNAEVYTGGEISDCDEWQVLERSWAISDSDWPPSIGWEIAASDNWTVDWSAYAEGNYYMFQRVNDGYSYAYSTSLPIVVGPPTLYNPPIPIGPSELVCDDAIVTYDAGEYMTSCPGLPIIREWAVNEWPTAPLDGWTVFPGTTFDVDPATLGFGNVYIFQRATLDLQQMVSSPITVDVLPGMLGTPDMPVGPDTVTCESTHESYALGSIITACPGTPITRYWQVQDTGGTPMNDWQEFTDPTIIIDWTIFPAGYTYYLVQKVEDAIHTETSVPLVVVYTNDEPDFLGGLSGPTLVNCGDTGAFYDGGIVYDCDNGQTLVREWALNTVNVFPVSGWEGMFGSNFTVNYGSPDILPGTIYLFQRVSDGIVTVYDPVSLEVTYENSPPDKPSPPNGQGIITCNNEEQTYYIEIPSDCDGQDLTTEWAVGDSPMPPTDFWTPFIGTSFDVDWYGFDYGFWYLFVRVSDGTEVVASDGMPIAVVNTPPEVLSFGCTEGLGPFVSDGSTTSLSGQDFINTLHFTFSVEDCDGETPVNYWAITTSPFPLPLGDPAWNGPIAGNSFNVNLADHIGMAPGTVYIQFGSSDGIAFPVNIWEGSLDLWQKVFVTDFGTAGDMWNEHACVTGTGSYSWGYDAGNGYLRLDGYGAGSQSAVWSDPVTFPAAPEIDAEARLMTYMNPALAEGLDNAHFSFLDDVGCTDYDLELISGMGCEVESPSLREYNISSYAPMWSETQRVGIYESGLTGCDPSSFYLDWVGVWITPQK